MPSILDYDELDLTGMEIDPISWQGEILRARYGSGFGDKALVGAPSGLWGWEISSEALPDALSYGSLIGGKPRFQYYFDFIKEHTTGDGDVFVIDFRGKKFHASFADPAIAGSLLTYDVFSLSGVKLEMRRVKGIYYLDDGSIFDPRDVPSLYGWWREENFVSEDWEAINDPSLLLSATGDVTHAADVQNGRGAVRLNATGADGVMEHLISIQIYAAVIVMSMREATFSNNAGILTGAGGSSTKILVGSSGTTKFTSQSFGSTFHYKLNGTSHAESDEQAPMNAFGIVSAESDGGLTLDVMQIGQSRNTAGTFGKIDYGEIMVFGGPPLTSPVSPSAGELANILVFLKRGWATP